MGEEVGRGILSRELQWMEKNVDRTLVKRKLVDGNSIDRVDVVRRVDGTQLGKEGLRRTP